MAEERRKKMQEILRENLCSRMITQWIYFELACILPQIVVLGLSHWMGPRLLLDILRLPSLGLYPLDVTDVVVNTFIVTISISGILLGLTSVLIGFHTEWLDAMIRESDEAVAEKKKNGKLYSDFFWHFQRHFTRFSRIYISVSVFLIVIQACVFPLSTWSGFFSWLTLMMGVNGLLITTSGFVIITKRVLFKGA